MLKEYLNGSDHANFMYPRFEFWTFVLDVALFLSAKSFSHFGHCGLEIYSVLVG